MQNAIYSSENLCKEEILDTVDMVLDVLAPREDFRPKMSDSLRARVKEIGGDELPEDVEQELRLHEGEMEIFMKEMEAECKSNFSREFKRLQDRYPGIIQMILRYGEHSDLVGLRKMLELSESVEKKEISRMSASYQIGKELRNKYVNQRLGVNASDINEIDPNSVDIDRIKRENPHIFK